MKKKLIAWVKAHKKRLLIAGGAVIAIVGGVTVACRWDDIKNLFSNGDTVITPLLSDVSADTASTVSEAAETMSEQVWRIIFVNEFPRNLPKGQHASAAKMAEAAEAGVKLAANQTFVSSYSYPKPCAA